MSRVTPIVLLVLLVLAGAWVAVFEVREGTRFLTEGEIREREGRVFDVELKDAASASIRVLRIQRRNDVLVFQRVGAAEWRIDEPVKGYARPDILRGLAGTLLFLRKAGKDITPDEFVGGGLAAYGLAEPRLVVTVTTEREGAAVEHTVEIGDLDGTKRYAYARRPDHEGVMLIDGRLVGDLVRPVNDYRETKFPRFDYDKVVSVTLATAEATLEVRREPDGWRAFSPFNDRLDPVRTENVLQAVGGIEALTFVAEDASDLAPFGLDKPRIRVAYTLNDGREAELLIGAAADKPVGAVYARLAAEPTVYTIADGFVGRLSVSAEYLRDRWFARLSAPRVTEVAIERADRKLEMRRDAQGGWQILSPVKMHADPRSIDTFVRALAALRVVRFVDDRPDAAAFERAGLDPQHRVVIRVKSTDRPENMFTAGRVDDEQKDLPVMRDSSDSIYTVPGEFAGRLDANYLDFRHRDVADVDRSRISRIALARPEGDVTLARAADGQWRMVEPVKAIADAINVGKLLNQLHRLEAMAFIAEKVDDLGAYGLDKPDRTVRVTLIGERGEPEKTVTLLIGKSMGEAGYAAKLASGDLVFTVAPTLVEFVGLEVHRRLVWQLDVALIGDLTWERDGHKATVRRGPRGWTLIEPAGREFDPMRWGDILDVVRAINVSRFEDYTKTRLAEYGLDKPRVVITVRSEDRDRVLSIGKDKNRNEVYAMVSDADGVFTLPSSKAALLMTEPLFPPKEGTPPASNDKEGL